MPEETLPQHTLPDDILLRAELRRAGHDQDVATVRGLEGGFAAGAWLVTFADGTRVVAKTLTDAPGDLFAAEAAGLDALRATGLVRTPDVLAVTPRLLLLAELPARDDAEAAWESLAVALAGLHRGTVHDGFGWDVNGYLGLLVQENDWGADGHEFFAARRLLRYLREPRVDRALTAADRGALEALCDRLPDLVPPMPAVLTHGDLWCGNVLGHPDGGLTLIDPAVSYTLAEVDLSMLYCCPRPPATDRFFAVYQDLNPSPPGWAERMPLLHLRELLSTIAHLPDAAWAVARVRDTLAPFCRS